MFIALWVLSVILVALAVGGAASLLSAQARFKRIDTSDLATSSLPLLPGLAEEYADAVGEGEETIRTRITVLRGGVSLAVIAALLYAVLWAFISAREVSTEQPPSTPQTGVTERCDPTRTTSSPSEPRPTMLPTNRSGTSPAPAPASPTR